MKLINQFVALLIIASILSCNSKNETQKITISNSSEIDLMDKPASILRSAIHISEENKHISLTSNGIEVPYQLNDLDNDGKWDELYLVTNLEANSSKEINIMFVDKAPKFEKKTNIRFGKMDSKKGKLYPIISDTMYANETRGALGYQPYQTDGPMWENDKVGFRHYFDGRNSKDLFGKKTPGISPDTVGIGADGSTKDNYHTMEDWGRDVLSVGTSAGLGGIELMIGDQIPRIGNFSEDTTTNLEKSIFTINTNGPVNSKFTLEHHGYSPVEDRSYTVTENGSVWPGNYGYKNEVTVEGLQGDEHLIVGLVNSNTDKPLKTIEVNDHIVLYTHDKQSYDKTWWLGLAVIVPKANFVNSAQTGDTPTRFNTSYYGKLNIENGKAIPYYTVGVWEYSADKGFDDEDTFVTYLTNFIQQVDADISISID